MKKEITHNINDDFITDVIEVIIETTLGNVSIATTYLPPRRPYLPFPDFHKLAYNNYPTYVLGDLSARSIFMGHGRSNNVGKGLERFMRHGKFIHVGPDFPTFHNRNSYSSPDVVLTNNKATLNMLIKPGPITTSDYIPIHMTITSEAITIPISPRLNLNKASWLSFKSLVEEEMGRLI